MPDLINWKPENLPPGAMPWARQIEAEIQNSKRLSERNDQSNSNTDKTTASTMSSLSDQIQAIQAAQAQLTTQQAQLTTAVNNIASNQAAITAQQAYLNKLQPVSASTSTGNTPVAAGAWGTVRPSVTLNTAAGGTIQITVSGMLVPFGGGIYGTYSISGASTSLRANRVAGNELYNNLLNQGTAIVAASKTWVIGGLAANASITVTAEFFADTGNTGNAAYAYPSIVVQNVS